MKTVQISGVPFAVPQICLGCAPYGTSIPKPAAHELMDYYYDKGGFFFNTAHEYGDGLSERCVGEWVASRRIRDKVIITTKGGEDGNVPGSLTLHRADILQDMDESLSRLGMDYVDFFMLHVDDPAVEIGEIMDQFRNMGARFVRMTGSGSTVFAVFDTDEAARSAASRIPGAIATRTVGE